MPSAALWTATLPGWLQRCLVYLVAGILWGETKARLSPDHSHARATILATAQGITWVFSGSPHALVRRIMRHRKQVGYPFVGRGGGQEADQREQAKAPAEEGGVPGEGGRAGGRAGGRQAMHTGARECSRCAMKTWQPRPCKV
jgi:hypothetical protein